MYVNYCRVLGKPLFIVVQLLSPAWLCSPMDCSMPCFPVLHSVQFTHSVMSSSLWPHGLQHARPSCSSPTSGVYSDSCPLSQWCHPTISSSVIPFSSCLQSFPASGTFVISQFFTSGGQSIEASASASVLPMNVQGWFPLGLTSLTSLLSKGLLQHHKSKTSVLWHSAFFYSTTLISVRDYWKNQSFDYMGLCWQSDVSAF